MKRFAAVIAMVLVVVLSTATTCFGLSVTKTTPSDGESGKQITNVAIKFTFSEKVDEKTAEVNKDMFTIKDSEGNTIPCTAVCDTEKYPNDIWVLCAQDLKSNTEYKVVASSGVKIGSQTLGKDYTLNFKTRNTKTDSFVSFGMMAIFMVAMFGATKSAQKNKAEEKTAVVAENNPYKIAKEKGISVEEARKSLEGNKEKKEKTSTKKAEKAAARQAALDARVAELEKKLEEEAEAARRALNYKVHRPASIVAKGHKVPKTVVRKNKAKREKMAKLAKK